MSEACPVNNHRISEVTPGYPLQELEQIAHRSASWEVLQRGGVALSQLWDEYKTTGDAVTYAGTLRKVFFAIAGPLLQSRLALSDEMTKVCTPSVPPLHGCSHGLRREACMSAGRLNKKNRMLSQCNLATASLPETVSEGRGSQVMQRWARFSSVGALCKLLLCWSPCW